MHAKLAPASLVLIAVSLVGIAGFSLWPHRPASKIQTIHASGTIEATEVLVSPKLSGRIVRFAVAEGSLVHSGDLIAQLDTEALQTQVAAAQAALAHAQAQWEAARNGNRPEQIAQARAQLAQAEAAGAGAYAALLDAREALQKVTELKAQRDAAQTHYDAAVAARGKAQEAMRLAHEGSRQQQIAQAHAAVDQAEIERKHNESDYRRTLRLYQEGAISQQQWEAARAVRDTAQTVLDQAKAHLADLQAGPRPEEIRQAEIAVTQEDANVEGARLALENARQIYQDRLDARSRYDAAQASYRAAQAQRRAAQAQLDLLLAGTRAEDLKAAQEAVRQAQANLAYAQTQRADARVVAPLDGVVNTKTAELGEVVAPGAPIVSLYDLAHPWLRVYVPENLYGRIKLGQAVQVTVDSYPKTSFHGTVSEIASDAEFTPKSVQTEEERVKLVYGIKVDLDNRDRRLKPGMPADAVFLTP